MGEVHLHLSSVTITAPDPRSLAGFYARLLDRPVTAEEGPRPGEPPTGGWAQIRSTDGSRGPTLNFEHEKQSTPRTWPSEPGEQTATQHLDIRVSDLDAAVEHAISAGASLAPVQPQQRVRVRYDPAGHPFCLFI